MLLCQSMHWKRTPYSYCQGFLKVSSFSAADINRWSTVQATVIAGKMHCLQSCCCCLLFTGDDPPHGGEQQTPEIKRNVAMEVKEMYFTEQLHSCLDISFCCYISSTAFVTDRLMYLLCSQHTPGVQQKFTFLTTRNVQQPTKPTSAP